MGKNLNKGVRRAIELAGGSYAALANKLNCSPEAVRKMQWVNCTAERAVEIENAVGVPREEIRPDIFLKDAPPPKPAPDAPFAISKEMRDETTSVRKPKRTSAYVPSAPEFGEEDGQIIEPMPGADEIAAPRKFAEQDHKAEIEKRIKANPHVDIARPGRRVQHQVAAEDKKPKTE